jgi:competence protein ComEC
LLLILSPELTVAGMLANVVAGPIGELAALPLCLVHAIASPLPWLERGLALSGSGALILLGKLAHLSAACRPLSFPLPPPTAVHVLVLIVGTVAWVVLSNSRVIAAHGWQRVLGLWLAVCGASLTIVEVGAVHAAEPKGILRITVVDVGQGDALLVDLPDGKLMLIDGGGALGDGPDPGRLILLPVLRARRRSRIDILVLTHPHPDHYGGLLALLPTIEVGEFWDGGGVPQAGETSALDPVATLRRTLREKRVPCIEPKDLCGRTQWFGTARVDILSPCLPLVPIDSANDASIVLRIGYGERIALLPGDAEQATEAHLIDQYGAWLHADLLKAGHHGSRTSSTTAFLKAVRPTSVAVSVGFRNRFGHPNPSMLERLSEASIEPIRTDTLGAIEWSTDGHAVSLRTAALFSSLQTRGQVSRHGLPK